MQIIKDKQLIANNWRYINEDVDLQPGDITVSVDKWKKNKQQLLDHAGKIGLRLRPSDSTDEIAEDLDKMQLIELDFPALADGRLFSHAWLLRRRHHYQGEIRATGHFLPDQVYYLARVGVNAFNPEKAQDLPAILIGLNDFSVTYQPSIN
jgi:uncharacterized protein (DUF934 family)